MSTLCLINGQPRDTVSVWDRGLQYGDGVFETTRIVGGRAVAWPRHQRRLLDGCARLAIEFEEITALSHEIEQLCDGVERGVLKVIVTRGVSGRGYRPLSRTVSGPPTRIVQFHPEPVMPRKSGAGIGVIVCATPWGINPRLAQIKHLNRLEQVLARAECHDDDIREGLMLDTVGNLISATAANVFLVTGGTLITPDVSRCGVAGITREIVMELAHEIGLALAVRTVPMQEVYAAEEVMLTNSLIGVWQVRSIDAKAVSCGPVAPALAQALQQRLAIE